jgi:hypothetical protein
VTKAAAKQIFEVFGAKPTPEYGPYKRWTYGSEQTMKDWAKAVGIPWHNGDPDVTPCLIGAPMIHDPALPTNVLRCHYSDGSTADIELFTPEEA